MKNKPNILVCPLDWGIGHATRCVPIIKELMAQKANVILATSGRSFHFLEKEFPTLQKIDFPAYQFSYPKNGSMALKMTLQSPKILAGIKKENTDLKLIVADYKIDAIISDNRYGLYSEEVPCIFMTHQVFIQTPKQLGFLKPILEIINKKYISRFNECWIPDINGTGNLSGKLSHQKPLSENYHFIGPLSRFNQKSEHKSTDYKYKVLVMLSGPEPQRTILEELLIKQLTELDIKAAMVCGKTEKFEEKQVDENIQLFSHLETKKLRELILDSEVIVSRPGYSTVMDLVALNKKAIFIPTPGQTEQEYLAKYYFDRKYFYSMDQKNIDLSKAIIESKKFEIPKLEFDVSDLKEKVGQLLSGL